MVKTGARSFRVWRRQADVARSEIAFGFSMRGSASGRSRYRYKSLLVCILAIHTQDTIEKTIEKTIETAASCRLLSPVWLGLFGGGLVGSSGGRRFVVSRRHLFVAIVVAAPSARYRVPPWMAMAGRANYVAILRHAGISAAVPGTFRGLREALRLGSRAFSCIF